MRKLFPLLAVAALFSGLSAVAFAATAAEDKTVTGDGMCAKCALKETTTCQNVVIVTEGDKKTTYYLEGDVSEKAHKKLGICGASKAAPVKLKVTGSLEEKDGKKVIDVKSIDKAD